MWNFSEYQLSVLRTALKKMLCKSNDEGTNKKTNAIYNKNKAL